MTNQSGDVTNEAIAVRLALCEEAYRRAQRSGCPARYRAALAELERVERLALVALAERVG